MNKKFHTAAFLILLLLSVSTSKIYARFLATKQGQEEQNLKDITSGDSLDELQGTESIDKLMGLEECGNEDEECLKRRMVADAHLDYIYTQHRKP